MKARHIREINTLATCQAFLDMHSTVVGSINTSGSRADLDSAIQAVSALGTEQALGKRQRAANANAAKHATRALRRAMRQVAEVAKSNFSRIPEFEALFMPPSGIRTSELLAAAGAMANAAQPFSDVFIKAGLAANFTDDIRARAATLNERVIRQGQAGVARSGATAGLRDAIKQGRRAVAVIDSLLMPILEEAPDLLAAWKTAKRVRAKPGPVTGTIIRI